MMEKSQNRSANGHQFADICKVCGKGSHGRDIRNHIEANHLEGVSSPTTSVIKLSVLEIVLGPTNHASIQTNLHARKIDLNLIS